MNCTWQASEIDLIVGSCFQYYNISLVMLTPQLAICILFTHFHIESVSEMYARTLCQCCTKECSIYFIEHAQDTMLHIVMLWLIQAIASLYFSLDSDEPLLRK